MKGGRWRRPRWSRGEPHGWLAGRWLAHDAAAAQWLPVPELLVAAVAAAAEAAVAAA